MNPSITKGIECLQQAHYAGFFQELDTIEMPTVLAAPYEEFKQKFMTDKTSFNFTQQLEVFAKELQDYLDNPTGYTVSEVFEQEVVTQIKNQFNNSTFHGATFA
jgi:hypothetical protein